MDTFQKLAENLVGQLDGEARKSALDRLGKMIDYGIKRQDWYEDQRNKILSLGLTLLGLASFLVAGLLNSTADSMCWFRLFACLTLIAIVGTALFIIFEYTRGASREYTHRSLADIRSWYFAYIFSGATIDAATFKSSQETANKERIATAWEKFVKAWMEYRDQENGFLIEDLQQVFILFLFQGMRRNSLRKMISRASIGGWIIGLLLIPTILMAALRL